MAFVTINPNTIEVGDPIKKELFDRIKANEDDHETRLSNLESTVAKIDFMKFMVANASSASSFTGMYYYEANGSFTITDAFIRIFTKGALTGNLEIDIKVSTTDMDNASFVSIFTTKPKIVFSSISDYGKSTNQAFDATKINIQSGDFLRLDVTELPTNGVISRFLIEAYGE